MAEDYARTLKRRTLIALIATLISLVLLGAAMFWLWCKLFGPPEFMRKDNPYLSPTAAQTQLEAGADATWREQTYQIPEDSGLGSLLHTDQWTVSAPFEGGEAEVVLHFAPLCHLSLWSDGKASFYDGYFSNHSVKTHAYYTIPTGVVKELTTALTALPA